MIMIFDRPAEANDRAVPGHGEEDLITGKANRSAIITPVERSSRYVLLGKPNYDHTTHRVASVLSQLMATTPERLTGSLTWDQGREMTSHAQLTTRTDIPPVFYDPHSPRQRRSNENTNGPLHEYFPQDIELQDYSQTYLNTVAHELNDRPRQTLN